MKWLTKTIGGEIGKEEWNEEERLDSSPSCCVPRRGLQLSINSASVLHKFAGVSWQCNTWGSHMPHSPHICSAAWHVVSGLRWRRQRRGRKPKRGNDSDSNMLRSRKHQIRKWVLITTHVIRFFFCFGKVDDRAKRNVWFPFLPLAVSVLNRTVLYFARRRLPGMFLL